jgi:hypothetical protein
MTTKPLPITTDPTSATPGRWLRAVELTAGLLGGGLLLLGVVLLVLQVVGPQVVDGADGPGWGRVICHLLVGAAGEGGRAARRRLPLPARAAVAGVTVLAVLMVLVLTWWW